MMRRPTRVIVVVSLVAVAIVAIVTWAAGDTGGAKRVFVPAGSQAPPGVPEPPDLSVAAGDPMVFSDPLGKEGVNVTTVDEANMPFNLDVPSDTFGEPVRFVVSNEDTPALAREAIWIFESPDIGKFAVIESVAFETQSELEEPAAQEAGCTVEYATDSDGYSMQCSTGGGSLQTLDKGTVALAIDGSKTLGSLEGPVLKTLTWIEPLEGVSAKLLEGHPDNAVLELKLYTLSANASISDLVGLANKM